MGLREKNEELSHILSDLEGKNRELDWKEVELYQKISKLTNELIQKEEEIDKVEKWRRKMMRFVGKEEG